MASANCSIDANGVPDPSCGIAGVNGSSGMFVGANKDNLGNVIGIGSGTGELGNFQWNSQSNILTPRDSSGTEYNNLNFSFDSNEDNITGAENGDTYKISIGSQTNKTFLFNAGTNTLKSNLSIGFSSNEQIYLNAGGLEGNLTLNSFNGNSTVNLTGGITGKITNIGSRATLNFTSPSKPITLNEIETTGGSTTINFSNATAIINGAMIVGNSGNYDITLDSTAGATNLTINGAINIIRTFTALGDTNTLTLNSNITTTNKNTIKTLVLGDPTGKKAGLLTISNNAKKDNNPVAITIDTLTSKHADSTLTISAGEVKITKAITTANANITLDSETTDSKTKLTLGNTTDNNTITNLTALSASNTAMNTLTIADTAKGANKIENLKLGDSTSGKAGLLTIANNGGALGIGTLTANGKGSKLALNGAYDAIGTLTLANGANLDLDASSVTDNNAKPLVVNTFTGSAGSELTISSGKLNITSQITAGNKVSNTFNIESGATLTLAGGFSTNGGGENKFFVKDNGTLTIEGIAGLNNKLTTTGAGSVSHFDIAANAAVTNFYDEFEATNGGINRLFYAQDLSLASITATGNNSQNIITLGSGDSSVSGNITEANGGQNTFTLKGADGNNKSTLTLNGADNTITTLNMKANGAFISNGDGTLTIGTLTTADASTLIFNKGTNTIKGGVKNTQATFNVESGVSLTFSSEITGAGSVSLQDKATLTLNGGNLKSLSTAGATTVSFASGTTTIEGAITAGTKNDFTLTSTSGTTSATFNGGISETGANNFKLDSANGATNLTLKGTDNAIATLTALGGDATNTNTLTIDEGANGTNTIATLNLGESASIGTKTGSLTIENSSGKILEITDFASQDNGNVLTIGAGEVKIANALKSTGANNNFTLDSANSATTLTLNGGNLNKLETKGTKGNTINLNGSTTTIENPITADDGVTNTFNIGETQQATLTLTKGFLTNGGKNSFTIYENGTLDLGTTLNNGLTTEMGTTEFIIKERARFEILKDKAIIANSGGTNIIDTENTLNLSAITANGGINEITLRGTASGTNMAVGAITKNGGANNFTLDSSAGATALTLKGNTNQITNFTAFGEKQNTITINSNTATADKNTIANLVLGDSQNQKAGLLEIDNKGSVLTITNFESKYTGSKLTISGAGEVKIKNALKNTADINFTLNNAILTLDNANGDSTIANLTTTGTNNTINFASNTTTITSAGGISAGAAGVINNIKLGEGAILASVITVSDAGASNNITLADNSNITGDITATNGTNTINLTGTSATITGNLIQKNSGANKISFDSQLESQTLHLKGNSNTITTLTLSGQSNTINLAGEDNPKLERNDFRLLTVGTKSATPSTDTGLIGNEETTLTFESYINPKANNKVTLGGEESKTDGTYGYAYSDRVIIHNAGENTAPVQGTYNFKAYYSSTINESDLKSINYTEGKGTDQEGNIAILTIAQVNNPTGTTAKEKGIFQLEDKNTTRSGLDFIQTTLTAVETDENGKVNADATQNKYVTYFVGDVKAINPDQPDQGGKPENPDQGGDGNQGNKPNNGLGNIQQQQKEINSVMEKISFSIIDLYLANFNSLNKRMGELRENNHSQGIWGRVFNGQQGNNLGIQSKTNYITAQAGYDYAFGFEGANNYLGFAISYSHSSGYKSHLTKINQMKLDGFDTQLVELALYNSYVADSGWYNDSIAKASFMMNSISIKDDTPKGINGAKADFNSFALSLSNEFGYRFLLGEDKEWSIDPQAELGVGYINGSEFILKAIDGMKYADMTINSMINLRSRMGASLGYDFKSFIEEKDFKARVYVGLFYEMDYFHFKGDGKMKYKTSRNVIYKIQKNNNLDHRAVLNLGTNLTIKDATRIYLDFEKSFGGKITTDYKINAGVRYSFGENAGYKSSNAVQKDNEVKEAPLKLQENEEEE